MKHVSALGKPTAIHAVPSTEHLDALRRGLPPVSRNLVMAGFICPGWKVQVDMNFIIPPAK
jgi:hypothetical protein